MTSRFFFPIAVASMPLACGCSASNADNNESYAESQEAIRFGPPLRVNSPPPVALGGWLPLLPGLTDVPPFARDRLRDWLVEQVRSNFPETVENSDDCGEQIYATPPEIPEVGTSFLAGQSDTRQLEVFTLSGDNVTQSGCDWSGGCAITTYTSSDRTAFPVSQAGVVSAVARGSGSIVVTTRFLCMQRIQPAPSWGRPRPPLYRPVLREFETVVPVDVCSQEEPLLDRGTHSCRGPEVTLLKTGEAALGGDVFSAVTGQLLCGAGCTSDSAFVPYGSTLILGAGAPPGSRILFNGWAGDCTAAGNSPSATILADANRSCSADFACETGTTWNATTRQCEPQPCSGLGMTPTAGIPGTEVFVTGSGYVANEVVTIYFDGAQVGGSNQPGSPYFDHYFAPSVPSGTFRVEVVGSTSGTRLCALFTVP
jgi:hypothetical protein